MDFFTTHADTYSLRRNGDVSLWMDSSVTSFLQSSSMVLEHVASSAALAGPYFLCGTCHGWHRTRWLDQLIIRILRVLGWVQDG